MKRLSASLLAASLAFAGNAAAQSSGYYSGQQDGYYDSGQNQNAAYDYARVIRVDPVIESGYRGQSVQNSQRCYYRQADDVYVGNGGYNNGYSSNGYSSNGYSSNGYSSNGYSSNGYSNNGYYGNDGYSNRNGGYRNPNGSETGRTVATVIGGIAGAVLGSKVGNGSGQYVGTAVGSMVGGLAGRSIYDNTQRNRQLEKRGTVRVCDPVPVTSRSGGYNNDGYYDGNENLAGYDVTYEYANRTYRTRTNYHPGDRIRVRVDVRPE